MKNLETPGKPPDFDRLTGMDSRALVAGEVEELRRHFGAEPPAGIEAELLRRLQAFFALNGGWRTRILQQQDPEFVKIFLRRWISELLFHHARDLYERLPRSYRTGGALPPLHALSFDVLGESRSPSHSPVAIS